MAQEVKDKPIRNGVKCFRDVRGSIVELSITDSDDISQGMQKVGIYDRFGTDNEVVETRAFARRISINRSPLIVQLKLMDGNFAREREEIFKSQIL